MHFRIKSPSARSDLAPLEPPRTTNHTPRATRLTHLESVGGTSRHFTSLQAIRTDGLLLPHEGELGSPAPRDPTGNVVPGKEVDTVHSERLTVPTAIACDCEVGTGAVELRAESAIEKNKVFHSCGCCRNSQSKTAKVQCEGTCTHSRRAYDIVERLGEQVAGVETRLRGRHETYVRNSRASRVAETVDELEVGRNPRGLWVGITSATTKCGRDRRGRGGKWRAGRGNTHQTFRGRARLGRTSGTGFDVRYAREDVVARAIAGVAEERSE
jgi:hypothetical protein